MSLKIVFMGTPEFSVQILETLVNSDYEICCVYTQPPKKSFRGKKINASPVQKFAKKLNIEVRSPENLNDEREFNYFKSIRPFIVIVVAYGKIIPKRYLELAEKGFINIHASLLPKWRGAAPIQRSIMNKELESGVSFMKIEEGLDVGPYMRQIKTRINKNTTSEELNEKLSKISSENILECLNLIENEKAIFIKQNDNKATYAKKIEKYESKIIWSERAENILAKINGLNPYPGAWFQHQKTRYKIWKAEISNLSGNTGEIIDEKLIIACKDKSIKILEIQKEGKNKLNIQDFLKGTKFSKGDTII